MSKKYKIIKDIPIFISKGNIVTEDDLLKWFSKRGIEILLIESYISNCIAEEIKFIGNKILVETNTLYYISDLQENLKRQMDRGKETIKFEVNIDSDNCIEPIEIITE
jgi:hypothetical protein